MKSQPKILVVGIGSIGTRHISNLLSLGYQRITLISKRKEFPPHWPQFLVYPSFSQLPTDSDFTHALICSSTANHVEDLTCVVNLGIPFIFIEKPLSHSMKGLKELESRIKPHQKIVMGFDLRFDPGLNQVKEILSKNQIGRVLSVNAFVGQYLPDWRPHEDYRIGSSALKSKGGGVLLDLVHEFDYLFWLFGKAKTIGAFYQTNPELEIETEDLADVLIKFTSGVTALLHLDYHQRKLVRYCHITGTNGSIRWDLADKQVVLTKEKGETYTNDFSESERNDRFLSIIKAFMEDKKDSRLTFFSEGQETLNMVLAAKKSSDSLNFVSL